ncbi:hypothetical protein [Rhodoplanes serenus]|uniref:hypothetical protein n=1 Tax=Rhodoplanes serenus TaxID=200615 RepID=UPI000DAEA255|nr:hypothetical protein [Rhodoplanes serenus]RAI33730.1 hypothetical protein CH340_11315 [Rhodoplanes serenus]
MGDAVLGLDLASRTGWALGPAGAVPQSGTVVLKEKHEGREACFGNAIFWFNDLLGGPDKPVLIVKESPFHLGAFAKRGNSADAVMLTYGLHAVVEGIAHRFGVRVVSVAAQTVRHHFLGKANCGDRKATKAAVVARAHLLGLLPKRSIDADRADAIAIHDWACATYARGVNRKLFLFGEVAK